jgi:hypothetical protein
MFNSEGQIKRSIPTNYLGEAKSGGGIAVVGGIMFASLSGGTNLIAKFNINRINFETLENFPTSVNDFANIPFYYLDSEIIDTSIIAIAKNKVLERTERWPPMEISSIIGRKPVIQDSVVVEPREVHFIFSTPNTKDKVKITVGYNGNALVKNLSLGPKGFVTDLVYVLPNNANYLVLDLVGSKDNVPVIIDVRVVEKWKDYRVRLNSDYTTSGAIKIICKD